MAAYGERRASVRRGNHPVWELWWRGDVQVEGSVYRGSKQRASGKQQFAHLARKAPGVNYTSNKAIIRYLSRTRRLCKRPVQGAVERDKGFV